MNTPTFASEHGPPSISVVASPSMRRSVYGDDAAAFSRQLAVIPGMLSALDTATTAGQRDIMSKVVSFIDKQAGRAGRDLSLRNQRMFAELLGHLTHESERLLPDPRSFIHRTESLVALLTAIA